MSDTDERSTEDQSPDLLPLDIPRSAWALLPTLSYSSITAWGRLLSGTLLSIGGMVAGTYVLRNGEQPTGWAITSFSLGAAGVYLAGKSVRNLWCTPSREGLYSLDHGTAADYEGAYFAANPDVLRRSVVLTDSNIFSRPNSESLLPISSKHETSYDIPQTLLGDVSSGILNMNLDKYLPRSTDVSVWPSDKDRWKRKMCLRKDSASAKVQDPKDDFVISMNVEANIEDLLKESPVPGQEQGQDTDVTEEIPSEESPLSLNVPPSDKDHWKRKMCLRKEWSSASAKVQDPKDDFVISMNVEAYI